MSAHISHLKDELSLLHARATVVATEDPVFEGLVRDFDSFQTALENILKQAFALEKAVIGFYGSMSTISECFVSSFMHCGDDAIASDCLRLKEAVSGIANENIKHSSLKKFRTNLEYNIIDPIRKHLANARKLNGLISMRQAFMKEVCAHEKFQETLKAKGVHPNDEKMVSSRGQMNKVGKELDGLDEELFDWLMALQEYRNDIYDSTAQTMKFLLYEAVSVTAHQLATVLPATMEFRPMIEMVPSKIQADIDVVREAKRIEQGDKKDKMEISDDEDAESRTSPVGPGATSKAKHYAQSFSSRMINRIETGEGDSEGRADSGKALAGSVSPMKSPPGSRQVDALDLAVLLSQGFEEAASRRALLESGGDVSKAVGWLLKRDHIERHGGKVGDLDNSGTLSPTSPGGAGAGAGLDGEEANLARGAVRQPVSHKMHLRVQKLKEQIAAHKNANRSPKVVMVEGIAIAPPKTPEMYSSGNAGFSSASKEGGASSQSNFRSVLPEAPELLDVEEPKENKGSGSHGASSHGAFDSSSHDLI